MSDTALTEQERTLAILINPMISQFFNDSKPFADELARVAIDESRIGTPGYAGVAYFWGQDYKATLRDASPEARKAVYDAFLAAGLELGGSSDLHRSIVKRLTSNY